MGETVAVGPWRLRRSCDEQQMGDRKTGWGELVGSLEP